MAPGLPLFGGGGVDRADGRPHTWALDVTTDRWSKLDLKVEPPAERQAGIIVGSVEELVDKLKNEAKVIS